MSKTFSWETDSMTHHQRICIGTAIICCFIFLFTGCDNGSSSSSDSINVVDLENGVLIQTSSDVRRFDVDKDIAYIVKKDANLQVIDISDIESPESIDSFPVDPGADIAIGGDILYVLQNDKLTLYDVSDPASIKLKQKIGLNVTEPIKSGSICYNEGRIFIVLMVGFDHGPPYSYFFAINANSPTDMTKYQMENVDKIVGVDDNLVYTQRYSDIFVVDVSDLTNIESSIIHLDSPDPLELVVTNKTAYFIDQTGSTPDPLALAIIDTNSSSGTYSKEIGYLPFTGKTDRGVTVYPKSLVIKNNTAYAALIDGELLLFDVSVPAYPALLKTIDYNIVDQIGVPEIVFRKMQIKENKAIIGCSQGLVILNIEEGNNALQGIFVDSPAAGVAYETPSQSGFTNTSGRFLYNAGETVNFSLGGVALGSAQGKAMITPVDLVPGAIDETDSTVTNIARFLLSLDEDCNPANGISISQAIRDEIQGRSIDFSSNPDDFEIQTEPLFAALNARNLFVCGEVSLCSVEEARRHLRTTIRGMSQFKLTVKAGNHSTVVIDPQRDFYDDGEQVTLTTVPEIGWKFGNWLGDVSPYDNPVSVIMNADKTVVSVPETVNPESFQVPMVLRITEVGSGTVNANPPGGTYHADPHGYINKNIVVTLTAKPGAGWIFDHWEADLTGNDNPETIMINAYKNVTAVFTRLPSNRHTLWVDKQGLGCVRLDPPGGVYYEGTHVVLTAIPDNGWTFKQWGGDLTGSDKSKTLLMNSDYMISAEFDEIPSTKYTLTAQTDRGTVVGFKPPAEMSWEGSTVRVKYKPGINVEVTAVTRPGYTFVEWGGDLTGSENPQTIVMDSDKTISLASKASP